MEPLQIGGDAPRAEVVGLPLDRAFACRDLRRGVARMLLYGGFDLERSNELWRFDGAGWEKKSP